VKIAVDSRLSVFQVQQRLDVVVEQVSTIQGYRRNLKIIAIADLIQHLVHHSVDSMHGVVPVEIGPNVGDVIRNPPAPSAIGRRNSHLHI
jgi:hypothetical protein